MNGPNARRTGVLLLASIFTGALAAAQPAQPPIRIGFGMALSRGLAASGKQALVTYQLWAEDVNARGGLPNARWNSSTTTTSRAPRLSPASTRSCSTSTRSFSSYRATARCQRRPRCRSSWRTARCSCPCSRSQPATNSTMTAISSSSPTGRMRRWACRRSIRSACTPSAYAEMQSSILEAAIRASTPWTTASYGGQ
jgi:hypothetical protein